MFKTKAAPLLALLFVLFAPNAHAFLDPPYVTPAHPVAGEVIQVNIYGGVCDAIVGIPGYPQITQTGNAIRILFWSVSYHDPILCNLGLGTSTNPVGSYAPGSYTLQVDRQYFDDLGNLTTSTLGVVPFNVSGGASPVAAPAVGESMLKLLIFLMLGIAFWRLRLRGVATSLLLLACLSPNARSQEIRPTDRTIELLLTASPGAPTSKQVVDYFAHPTGAVPLISLAEVAPQNVQFLLRDRADGDFLARLDSQPNSARAKLERIVLVTYPQETDLSVALSHLRADPFVASANLPLKMQFSSAELTGFSITSEETISGGQYGRDDLNVDAAWLVAGGYALVEVLDSGLFVDHPALRQFSGSVYVGGNFIPAASRDVGGTGIPTIPDDSNVDELEKINNTDTHCALGLQPSTFAGHGTHTAGLVGANGDAGMGVKGICKHCGIAMWKVAWAGCDQQSGLITLFYNQSANAAALNKAPSIGAQVVSMSFGADTLPGYCASGPPASDQAMCLAITLATGRDLALVAASGNSLKRLQFPANDDRVIAAGGFNPQATFWDDFPLQCPPGYYAPEECGSNFTDPISTGAKQELLASAKSVLSTTYPMHDWNDATQCGDLWPNNPVWGNGIGWCTGTSMSSPQIAGVVGILRSINPLVHVGPLPVSQSDSIRSVLASTTAEASAGPVWNFKSGWGRPDAAKAAAKMLGKVAGTIARNRVTPLFRLYNATNKDYADTTSPQFALSLNLDQTVKWTPDVAAHTVKIPGGIDYTFPHGVGETPDVPRAAVYVLTTEFKPRQEWPALIPLYLMDKPKAGGTDYMLVTNATEIQNAHTAGYNLRTIQGYIYQPCTPEPTCIPPAAVKIWREYSATNTDCAVFLDSEKSTFELPANGYSPTAHCPGGGSSNLLGYAYPSTDSDGDGLPDGFEYVVGTNPNAVDSDGDGISDAVEIPMIGVPVSDPCMGGTLGPRNCGADVIFKNGFD